MSKSRNLFSAPKAGVLAVAAAVVAAGAGLFAITVDHSVEWTPQRPDPVAAVPVTPWTPALQDLLNGPRPSAGTSSSSVPAGAGTEMKVSPASFTRMVPLGTPGPIANDNGAGNFAALPGVASGAWGTTGQTGGFTWNYPFSARKAPAGPTRHWHWPTTPPRSTG